MFPVEPLETPFPSRTVGGLEAEVQCQVCSPRVGWQASRKEGSGTLGTFLGSANWHFSLTYLLLQPWTLNRPSLLQRPLCWPHTEAEGGVLGGRAPYRAGGTAKEEPSACSQMAKMCSSLGVSVPVTVSDQSAVGVIALCDGSVGV